MSAQESLVSFIQELKLDDDKFLEFQEMIKKKLSTKKKNKKETKNHSEQSRNDVFEHDSSKGDIKKRDKKTLTKENPSIIVQQENPKTKGSKVWSRYEKYKAATTYKEFIEKGGTNDDFNFDLNHNPAYIRELGSTESISKKEDENDVEKKSSNDNSESEVGVTKKISKEELVSKDEQEAEVPKESSKEESENETELAEDSSKDEPESEPKVSKESSKEESESEADEESAEKLDSHVKSCLNKLFEDIVSRNNYENKKKILKEVKIKLFEDNLIKKEFKKSDKTLNNLIISRYNELYSFYESKCQEEFDDITKQKKEDDHQGCDDEENEEIEVLEKTYEGVVYLYDPKTNLVYDSDTNEQVGKIRDGIIIFE